jgi:hypothetical protein
MSPDNEDQNPDNTPDPGEIEIEVVTLESIAQQQTQILAELAAIRGAMGEVVDRFTDVAEFAKGALPYVAEQVRSVPILGGALAAALIRADDQINSERV